MARDVVAERLASFGTTVFAEISALAVRHSAVNLGQGFPDFDGPEFLKRAAAEALGVDGGGVVGSNQYARMAGVPALVNAIAREWERATGTAIDAEAGVTVTSGCTEALAAAMLGLVNPGEEAILFEPFYDSYRACVAMAGGRVRTVTLRPGERGIEAGFGFDPAELAAAFGPKTRAIVVNTPHNPTGKVFSREELVLIARLCVEHDVIAISDEVYEHLVYEEAEPHVRLATLEGMADRTLTLSSLGKTFSFTGWKVGWAIGSPALSRAVRAAHQFLTFATCTPMQVAAAKAIGSEEGRASVRELNALLRANRDELAGELRGLGFRVAPAAGGYFLMADWTGADCLGGRLKDARDDVEFCRALTERAGVAAIPPSAFYEHAAEGGRFARFAFCKRPETLRAAVSKLRAFADGGDVGDREHVSAAQIG